jgi:hypothetical protein
MKWTIKVFPQACSPMPFCAFAERHVGRVLVGVNAEGRTAEEAIQKLKDRLNARS